MSALATLFSGDFETYFAQAAPGAAEALWLFVHVPKTAGSSMQAEMSAIHKPAANIQIDYTDSAKPYAQALDEAVQRFIDQHKEVPYRFATGHILCRHTEKIREAVPDARIYSMLRNPLARLISDYRYQRSEMNVARANFIATTPDFQTYVARPHVHNKTALALVPRPMVMAGDTAGAIDYIMKNYIFIGLQEMYPLHLRAITTMMGYPRSAEAKVRVNTEEDNKVILTPEEEAEMKRLNAVDFAIFNEFTAKWRPVRDNLRAFLATYKRPRAA